mgnify:CR=1 FL=1
MTETEEISVAEKDYAAGQWQLAWRSLKRNKVALASGAILALLYVAALLHDDETVVVALGALAGATGTPWPAVLVPVAAVGLGRGENAALLAARILALGDDAMDRVFEVDMVDVFREDVAILEAQQRMMELKPDAPQIDINVDAAPITARRMLDELIAAEHGEEP